MNDDLLQQVLQETFFRVVERILAEIEKVGFETFKRRVEDQIRTLQVMALGKPADVVTELERELQRLTGGNA